MTENEITAADVEFAKIATALGDDSLRIALLNKLVAKRIAELQADLVRAEAMVVALGHTSTVWSTLIKGIERRIEILMNAPTAG